MVVSYRQKSITESVGSIFIKNFTMQMANITKSMIRHFLTGLGAVLAFFGFSELHGAINFTLTELDNIWASVTSLIGILTIFFGFFKDKERLEDRKYIPPK